MKVGDLVQVNKQCDGSGLWGMRGIVTEIIKRPACRFPHIHWKMCARVLLPIRLSLIEVAHLDVINESR